MFQISLWVFPNFCKLFTKFPKSLREVSTNFSKNFVTKISSEFLQNSQFFKIFYNFHSQNLKFCLIMTWKIYIVFSENCWKISARVSKISSYFIQNIREISSHLSQNFCKIFIKFLAYILLSKFSSRISYISLTFSRNILETTLIFL